MDIVKQNVVIDLKLTMKSRQESNEVLEGSSRNFTTHNTET